MIRRGFTLLETMLAAAIGAVVVLACVAIMYSMNRTDRLMEVRADERAGLGRVRTVMERAFSSLLMSDEPQSRYDPDATDTSDKGQFSGRLPPANRARNGTTAAQPAGTSGKVPGRTPGAVEGGDTAAGENAKATPERREPLPPPPARMILGLDTNAPATLRYQPDKNLEALELSPQRLEVVLHRSPVPQATVDPLTMPLPARSYRRNRSSEPEDETAGGRRIENVGMGAEEAAAEGEEAEAEDAAMPVRAVRGAFELHPQPARGLRAPGRPVAPVDPRTPGFEPTGLWELWWVPLPPPESEGMTPTRREAMFAGLGQPFFIAGDLRYARWTAFFRRSKRADLISTWSSELPAYVELQVETASGLQSNWMFELDWALGPEVAKRPDTTEGGGAAADGASRGNADNVTGASPITRTDRPAARAGGGRTLGRPASKPSTAGAPSRSAPPPPGGKQ